LKTAKAISGYVEREEWAGASSFLNPYQISTQRIKNIWKNWKLAVIDDVLTFFFLKRKVPK